MATAKAKSGANSTKASEQKSSTSRKTEPDKKASTETPQGADNWFKTGDAGLEQKASNDAAARQRKERATGRFWLNPGEEATVVFIDDILFYAYNHLVKVGNKKYVNMTCVKDYALCSVCDKTDKYPTWTGYASVIDTRIFTGKDGKEKKNRKILFPAVGDAISILADFKKANGGTLAGKAVVCKRYGEKDPRCGTIFTLRSASVNLKGEMADPLDYKKLLAPPTKDELAYFRIGSTVAGSIEDLRGNAGESGLGDDLLGLEGGPALPEEESELADLF